MTDGSQTIATIGRPKLPSAKHDDVMTALRMPAHAHQPDNWRDALRQIKAEEYPILKRSSRRIFGARTLRDLLRSVLPTRHSLLMMAICAIAAAACWAATQVAAAIGWSRGEHATRYASLVFGTGACWVLIMPGVSQFCARLERAIDDVRAWRNG